MNKKLIVAAVSAAIMAPVAAQAEVTVYGRINNALDIKNVDGDGSTIDISGVASRFGIKASADLGNGLTASARYEFATITDKEIGAKGAIKHNDGKIECNDGEIKCNSSDTGNPSDLRIGTVGLSGAFGSITVGNQWSAFYNTLGTDIDPTYNMGYYLYSSFVGGPYRASNTLKYANSFGPVYLEFDARFNGKDEKGDVAEKLSGDGFGLGARLAVTDNLTLSAALDSEDGVGSGDDTDRMGLAAKMTFGGFTGRLGWHKKEVDDMEVSQIQAWGGMAIGDATTAMLGYGVADDDSGKDPSQIVLGVYHNLGGGLKLWYEGTMVDYDKKPGKADITRHMLGMRIDF